MSETYNHVLYHKPIEGEAISEEKYYEYAKMFRLDLNKTMCTKSINLFVNLPRNIELAKEISKYSVEKINGLEIIIDELYENVLECLQKLLRSFAYTQIKILYLRGCEIHSEVKEHDSHSRDCTHFCKVYPCSNFFDELLYTVSRATIGTTVCSLELSSKEFIQLVKAAKKVNTLIFKNCKISLESEFDFGSMEGCLIKKIYIGFYDQVYDEWSEYEECLIKIFCGIINCKNLIRNLNHLNFKNTHCLKEILIDKAKEQLGDEYLEIMPSLKKL